MAISRFALRPDAVACAVRARNAGANPRLTRVNAPSFRNTRREIMSAPRIQPAYSGHRPSAIDDRPLKYSSSLKLRRAERQRELLIAAGDTRGDVHARHQRAGIDPGVGGVGVAGRRLALIERHAEFL